MRVFVCAFEGFNVAVPMPSVASLANISDLGRGIGTQRSAMAREKKSGNIYVSLPLLFGFTQENLRHGIILKNPESADDAADDTVASTAANTAASAAENKIILLSSEIVSSIEIQEEEIRPIPNALRATKFYKLFSGIICTGAAGGAGIILILNPQRLAPRAVRKLGSDKNTDS